MTICENRDICCFFENHGMGARRSDDNLRHQYCESGKEKCALYMVNQKIMKGYMLPDDPALDEIGRLLESLHPGESDRAREIISRMIH